MGHGKNYVIALIICAVLAPFVFFSSGMSAWKGNPFSFLWQEAIYPFEWVWHKSSTSVSSTFEQYIFLHKAAQENENLKRDLERLQGRLLDYEEQISENKRLRKALKFRDKLAYRLTAAEVVSHNQKAVFRSLRINRGRTDGLQVGMAVVSSEGVVGRVIRVGFQHSDVQLLIDPGFYMDVLLQRTRVRGVLSGTSQHDLELKLHKKAEIRMGDTIVSSGLVGGFPKGLPVGRVVRIRYENSTVAQAITVEPWVDFRRLEEVMVLYYQDEQMQKVAESAGADWMEEIIDQRINQKKMRVR